MASPTADGVALVSHEEIARRMVAFVARARRFATVVGVPVERSPELRLCLVSLVDRGGAVRVVLTPEQAADSPRSVEILRGHGAVVLVASHETPQFVVTDDAALEGPSAFEDVPHHAGEVVLVERSVAGERWARILARAKLAQTGATRARGRRRPWCAAQRAAAREVLRQLVHGDDFADLPPARRPTLRARRMRRAQRFRVHRQVPALHPPDVPLDAPVPPPERYEDRAL